MQKKKNKDFICTYVVMMLGVILGSCVFLFCVAHKMTFLLEYGLEDYDVTNLENLSMNKIIFHILQKRIISIIIFMFLAIISSYQVSSTVFCGGFGVYYGLIVTNMIIKFDLCGLIYAFLCFFPHYYLYLLIIYWGGKWKMIRNRSDMYNNVMRNNVEYTIQLFILIVVFMLALLWEVFFEKIFLIYFFQYLV